MYSKIQICGKLVIYGQHGEIPDFEISEQLHTIFKISQVTHPTLELQSNIDNTARNKNSGL